MAVDPKQYAMAVVEDTETGKPMQKVSALIVGSLAKLSTEPFPAGVDGNTLIEFYPDNNNKYYRYYLGEWRLI